MASLGQRIGAHGNSCYGARLVLEAFVLWPWYEALYI